MEIYLNWWSLNKGLLAAKYLLTVSSRFGIGNLFKKNKNKNSGVHMLRSITKTLQVNNIYLELWGNRANLKFLKGDIIQIIKKNTFAEQ